MRCVVVGCESCDESCGGCDVEGCVDPRGCTEPPKSTDKIYGEYDGGGSPVPSDRRREYNLFQEKKIEEFEVGTTFWYMCSDPLIERFKNVDAIGKTPNENNTYKYITME